MTSMIDGVDVKNVLIKHVKAPDAGAWHKAVDKDGKPILDSEGNPLMQFKRTLRPVATVVAFKYNGNVTIGWSKCRVSQFGNVEPDVFDKDKGIALAIQRGKVHANEPDRKGTKMPMIVKRAIDGTPEDNYLDGMKARADAFFNGKSRKEKFAALKANIALPA